MKSVIISLVVLLCYSNIHGQSKIEFEAAKAYPEGIAYDTKQDRFFVSSVTTGTIGVVDKTGKYSAFYVDKNLKSSFGMKVDPDRNLLWVCVGDPTYSEYRDSSTYKKMGRVIAIDLTSAKKSKDIDLSGLKPGKHFPNDLTLDNKSNVYITDSFSPVIYKVDANGKASIFAESDQFKSVQVGLNGIVFHPDGYLLVAHNTRGVIYKVDVANPKNISQVKTDRFFPGADGMVLRDNKLYLVVGKGTSRVFTLTSNDKWGTAQVTAGTKLTDRFQNPTTMAMKSEKIFVLNAKLNELADSTTGFSTKFSIQEAQFEPVASSQPKK